MPRASGSGPHLGVIGVGGLGGAVARRLLDSRYAVSVFDINATRVEELVSAKALAAESPSALAARANAILLCLPTSESFVTVVEQQLLPGLTKGKTVIDLGTTELGETRRLAEWLEARGVNFLDAPVSGSPRAALEGNLSMFVGGKKEMHKRCLPLFKALAGLGNITYCGPAGSGQIVKGVEQLALGLGQAAFLEAIAYAGCHGVQLEELWAALERSAIKRAGFEQTIKAVLREGGEAVSAHVGELPYFLKSAAAQGQRLPLAEAVTAFLKSAPPSVIERGKHVPSFWKELKIKIPKANV